MAKYPAYKRAGEKVCKAIGRLGAFACKGLFWVCCGPCVLCACCFIKPRRCVRRAEPHNPPRPMKPKPRSRRLTLPLIEGQCDQKTFDQSQSPFFYKLPLEIRRKIYFEALGGVTIKLRTSNGKPIAQRCRCSNCLCYDGTPRNQTELDFGLSLLATCRQMYSEAIEFLYTGNAFSLSTWDDDYPTIDYMSYYFLQHRLTQIRRLHVDWEVDNFYLSRHLRIISDGESFAAWNESWDAIRTMTGIRQLRIVLHFRWSQVFDCYEEYWNGNELELLHPVKSITAPTNFVLVLPDRRCSTNVDMGESRCILQLPEEPHGVSDLVLELA